ncbi:MAG: MGH1-like glycoside hydrolase domain-containing protein [Alphaproteobacteria bacterium]
MSMLGRTEEDRRLQAAWSAREPWLRWGPYLSERQWGTVREDYSPSGDAWDAFPHDHARSRAYRWGEDGLAGLSDDRQRLCFALALWNGRDPILKERLFGLTNSQGNHGEDVKEYYFYQDSAPTHSYMRYLYKYPQAAYPYDDLIAENGRRKATAPGALEYELMDTGVFDDERYFDVTVEYAKAAPEDIYIRITAVNRGPSAETIWLLPTLWFRNTWSWRRGAPEPRLAADGAGTAIDANHQELGRRRLVCPDADELWFVDNETNARRLYGVDGPAYPKDGINDRLVHGAETVNPARRGTKAAAVYERRLAAGEGTTITLRLTDEPRAAAGDAEAVFARRRRETDAFYASRLPADLGDDRRSIARQAYAGMLWSKQYFHYVVAEWLDGDELPPPPSRLHGRNSKWRHVYADDVLSMPDKWEYPWFASWDLGFHTVALARVDLDFAKRQILLLCREWYMSPEGQVPAYEWAFDDVNPPVQAWAALQIAEYEWRSFGTRDRDFLRSVFEHGLLYFTWWVNRKDADGNNLFQGGFLGLDNIAAFDRSAGALPGGGRLYQSDGTTWVGFFALKLMEIATELAKDDPTYLDFAAKFFQHFVYIADALDHVGRVSDGAAELWSDADGLFFDVLRLGDRFEPMKVRSLVSLLPLIAVACLDLQALEDAENPSFAERLAWFRDRQSELLEGASEADGGANRLLLSFLGRDGLVRMLGPLLDENEFLSPYGIRSLSRRHADTPFVTEIAGERYAVDYRPAESDSAMFGGNSNWRGPVWMPANVLLIDALRHYYRHYGDTLAVELPTGSGVSMTLDAVADELSRRVTSIFEAKADGTRAVYGGNARFQHDPHWRDNLLFYEYFHGDNGAGIGASHQTGWTGLAAVLMEVHAEPPTAHDVAPSDRRAPLGLRPS